MSVRFAKVKSFFKRKDNIRMLALLIPGLAVIGLFTFYPIIKMFVMSFFDWKIGYQLLQKTPVQLAIAEARKQLQERTQVTADRVVMELGLIAFAGIMLRLTRSRIYAVPLVWALGWIAVANVQRQDEPLMAFTAVIGIGLLLALALTVRRRIP